ncbi:hypothetical protein V5O48_006019 [Marasmius crinis-equi]|uniref:Sulfotransferase n=1 Tax=Marasmius crinis-equi TaxID=585013 RepID=A0ABR3FKM8_9AGAR
MTTRDTPQLRKFCEDDGIAEIYKDFTFQYCLDELERSIAKAETEGKIASMKEHSYAMMDSETINRHIDIERESRARPVILDNFLDVPEPDRSVGQIEFTPTLPIPNPTLIPDRLFVSFTPVIIIRHPVKTLPSLLRASGQLVGATVFDADFPMDSSFKWQRMVYDCYKAWFSSSGGCDESLPIVIDADKLINNSEGQMEVLCKRVGLDPAGIKYTWETQAPDNQAQAIFGKTLFESTAVIQGEKTANPPVLEDEVKRWAKEWDEETAREMKRRVELNLPDYEYLLQRSI